MSALDWRFALRGLRLKTWQNPTLKAARILLTLDDNRFVVFAERAAERVGNFSHGGEGLHSGEDCGHEVFLSARVALHFCKCRARFRSVTTRTQRVQARHLRAL